MKTIVIPRIQSSGTREKSGAFAYRSSNTSNFQILENRTCEYLESQVQQGQILKVGLFLLSYSLQYRSFSIPNLISQSLRRPAISHETRGRNCFERKKRMRINVLIRVFAKTIFIRITFSTN